MRSHVYVCRYLLQARAHRSEDLFAEKELLRTGPYTYPCVTSVSVDGEGAIGTGATGVGTWVRTRG